MNPLDSSIPFVNFPLIEKSTSSNEDEISFNTLTIRLSSDEKKILESKLNDLPNKKAKINDIIHIINHDDFDNIFILEKSFDLYALQAVRENKITKEQFCTLMMLKSAFEEKDINSKSFEAIPLVNPKAWEILSNSNKASKNAIYLTNHELTNLINQMQKDGIPLSEQKFYIIPDTRKKYSLLKIALIGARRGEDPDLKVTHSLEKEVKFKFLITAKIDSNKYRVIPSFTLMQTVLKVHYGDKAIEMLPVISTSTLENLRDAQLEDKRDFAIPFSEYEVPKTADGFNASKLDFTQHDWYHAWLVSSCPPEHRKIFLNLSNFFENYKNNELADHLKNKMIDLENTHYRTENVSLFKQFVYSNDEDRFWNSLVMHIEIQVTAVPNIDAPLEKFYKSKLYSDLLEYLIHHKKQFHAVHLTLKSLEETCKSLIEKTYKAINDNPYIKTLTGLSTEQIIENTKQNSLVFHLYDDLKDKF